MAESLHCSSETITALFISCTLIRNRKIKYKEGPPKEYRLPLTLASTDQIEAESTEPVLVTLSLVAGPKARLEMGHEGFRVA